MTSEKGIESLTKLDVCLRPIEHGLFLTTIVGTNFGHVGRDRG